jgi:cobyrinic acid a,c-diamide synthase
MASFYISAAHKSSGKTTLSIGLAAAIRGRGLQVQTFKKGPDYIDPIWLSQASNRPCHNLDFFTSGEPFIRQQFQHYSQGADCVLVEGNMGLFDGISVDGSDSNAAMARLLNLPVVLVVDCSGTSGGGIAPLLNGYQQFDTRLRYAGVILNKTATERHVSKLTQFVEAYTDFTILGTVPRNPDIQLTERHLGLIPSNEMAHQSEHIIEILAEQVNQHICVDLILEQTQQPGIENPDKLISQDAPGETALSPAKDQKDQQTVRIAIAQDAAFGFYYPGDLERFNELGVELVSFNALEDGSLPEAIDGLFIGGGFPETQAPQLSGNSSLMKDIKQHIEAGLPCYAECGGLMYLCKDLEVDNSLYPMCGVIPAQVNMNKKPQGRGYVILQPTDNHPWYRDNNGGETEIKAHEFHYSALHGLPEYLEYAYSIKRGTGIDGLNDGIIMHNTLASYTHLRRTDRCRWVDDFVCFVSECKRQN